MVAMAVNVATLDLLQPLNIVEVAMLVTTTHLIPRRSHTMIAQVLEAPEAQEEKEVIPATENLQETDQRSVEKRRAMKREKQLGQHCLAAPLADVSLRSIHVSRMLTIQFFRGRA